MRLIRCAFEKEKYPQPSPSTVCHQETHRHLLIFLQQRQKHSVAHSMIIGNGYILNLCKGGLKYNYSNFKWPEIEPLISYHKIF